MVTVTVALPDRLVVCADDPSFSDEWNRTDRLEGIDSRCLAVPPDAPDRLFVGTFDSGLFRSTDGGESFKSIETDFVSDRILSLVVSPHDPDVVYAGTEPSRVYRSRDGGDTWDHLDGLIDLPSAPEWYFPPRPHTHHVRWIEVDPFDPDRLYLGIELGAFVVSPDGGGSWEERPPGARRDNHSLATHDRREGRIYAAAGDGFAMSDDAGRTFVNPQDGLDHRYCWSVVADPGDPDRILVSSAHGASTAHRGPSADSHIYRRTGDGPWISLEGRGIPTGEGVVRTEFATTGEPGVVYAVNNRGLFVTGDFGESWDAIVSSSGGGFEPGTSMGIVAVA